MIRTFALALALSCLATSAWAQAQPVPETAAAPVAVTKPAVKKQAPKTKTAAKPPGPAENGRCRLGVIPALGDQFVVQKVGLTVFGNERTEVPIDWGLNDLVVARVRAAAAPAPRCGALPTPRAHSSPITILQPSCFAMPGMA